MLNIRGILIDDRETAEPFLEPLKDIYADMDNAYTRAAAYYGFDCRGCSDNCCRTLFYHHTVLEYLYLITGWAGLVEKQRTATADLAFSVCRQMPTALAGPEPVHLMCPLNLDGLCLLYSRRPMICRLHGIPHELHTPGQPDVHGCGCDAFTSQCGAKEYFRFDRTPYYVRMARLEKDLRKALGISGKLKMTVAQMINENATLLPGNQSP